MIVINATRNKDNDVYSVTASCSKGAMKGPKASGLTTRRVIEGTMRVGHLYFHHHLYFDGF
jgi:hypothetical protein